MNSDELVAGALLEDLPVFPLPDVVLFPRTVLPLHVFEPRYLALVSDAMESDRLLGVVRLEPGWEADYYGNPPLSSVFGVGEIVRHELAPEGRNNILLKGLARVRLLGERESERGYRVVSAEVMEEVEGASAGQLATVRQLFASILAGIEGADLEQASVLFDAELPPGLLLDAIATAAPIASSLKQQLLEQCDHAARAEQLAGILAEWAAPAMEWRGPSSS